MAKMMGLTPMETHKTMHQYSYSGQSLNTLGASKYTLVTLVIDMSPSITDYKDDIEAMCSEVVKACKKHPNSEELTVRVVGFNSDITEIHGYKELRNIQDTDYKGSVKPSGLTALYEATEEAIEAAQSYGEQLIGMDYTCNAVLFVITDGFNNINRVATPDMIKKTLSKIKKDEKLDSVNVILAAASDSPDVISACETFQKDAGLNQFVKMGEATKDNLAKFAQFASASVSSTSQALGKGGTSKPITF
jgi:predicted metal-dependent peptidase